MTHYVPARRSSDLGLRWTSPAGLRWPEVDFRAKTITVPADRMKGKVEHTLPLGPEMLAMLRARRDQARSKEFVFPGLPKDEKGTMAPIGRLSKRRSEEHTSELQSLMRISYAVFCLKKKTSPTCILIRPTRTPNSP